MSAGQIFLDTAVASGILAGYDILVCLFSCLSLFCLFSPPSTLSAVCVCMGLSNLLGHK